MNREINLYLLRILQKYQARDLLAYSNAISILLENLRKWASSCYIKILISGSRAKGTAISLASDVDYMLSLANGCNQINGGLRYTYNQLHQHLIRLGCHNVRKQNVSSRITLGTLEIDITPATKQLGNTNDHSIWLSKKNTWQKTNIQKHIMDISKSGRTNEIKLIKIWRELNKLDFPSIYLEYLIIKNILLNKSSNMNNLNDNIIHCFTELAKDVGNPLYSSVMDPANASNILSDLINATEKMKIKRAAKIALERNWKQVFY